MSLSGRTVDNGTLSAFVVAKQSTPEGDAQAVSLVDETGAQVTIGSLATSAKQDTILGHVDGIEASLISIDGKIAACNTGSVTISGTVPVSGTFYQATQPVSGPLTDVQLRASAVPVSGTFYQATQPVSVSTLPLPSDAATATNQTTIIGHVDGIESTLTSIDGKITACNTGAIAGSVTCNAGTNLNTSTLATESTLSTLNGKITACNTGAVVVSSTPTEAIQIKTGDATTSGDTTIHTPSTDTQIKLNYVCLSANGANSADVTVIVKLGAASLYKISLKPGAIWSRNIGAGGRKYHSGATNAALVVNLSAAQTVHVSMEYEQV